MLRKRAGCSPTGAEQLPLQDKGQEDQGCWGETVENIYDEDNRVMYNQQKYKLVSFAFGPVFHEQQ